MATASVYDVNDLVRCSAAFTIVSTGAAVDPTAVTFKYQNPAGTETTYVYGTGAQVVKDSTGNYHVDISVTTSGIWHFRYEGTGTYQAASEDFFIVNPSEF